MPKIGIIPGDPSGIGPELIARLLAEDCAAEADILLIGDRHVFEMGQAQAGISHDLQELDATRQDFTTLPRFALHAMDTIAPEDVTIAQSTFASGNATLRTLDKALEFAQAGMIDAIVFGPDRKSVV